MDIQAMGAWGEMIGGVASLVAALGVIGSLIFVGLEVRRNTVMTQAQTRQAVADSTIHLLLARNDDRIAELYYKTDELSETETFQLSGFCIAGMRSFENQFFQTREGYFPPDQWNSTRLVMRMHFQRSKAFGQVWDSFRGAFTDQFVAEVETLR